MKVKNKSIFQENILDHCKENITTSQFKKTHKKLTFNILLQMMISFELSPNNMC